MAKGRRRIGRVLEKLRGAASDAKRLVKTATDLEYEGNLDRRQLEDVVELAFLKCYLQWEAYVEEVLLLYMQGYPDLDGVKYRSYVRPRDLLHAQQIARQGREFAEFGDDKYLREVAERFLEGGKPICTALNQCSVLKQMRKVRNRIAHNSEFSEKMFSAVVEEIFGVFKASVSTPGKLLLELQPRGRHRMRLIEYYIRELEATGERMAKP